jgi:hypothetical protein
VSDPLAQEELRAPATSLNDSDSTNESSSAAASPAEVGHYDAKLIIRCIGERGGLPLDGVRIYAYPLDVDIDCDTARKVDFQAGTFCRFPITGKDGEAELDCTSGFRIHLSAIPELYNADNLWLEVPALAPDEKRELVLRLPIAKELVFHGLVVAHESQEPIADAKVRLLICVDDFDPDERAFHEVTRSATDRGGRFETRSTSSVRPFARIDADGFVPRTVALSDDHSTRRTEQLITLDRGAAIDVTVTGPGGALVAGVLVEAVAGLGCLTEKRTEDSRQKESSEELSQPNGDIAWSATTGADGRCMLEGLSAKVPLHTVVRRGDEVLLDLPLGKDLDLGERREVSLRIGACNVSGTLRDQNGAPIGHREIWCVRALVDSPDYLTPYDRKRLEAKAVTTADGKFELREVQVGGWSIGPAPPDEGGTASKGDDVAPFADFVWVGPDTPQMMLDLTAGRGLYICGRVHNPHDDYESCNVQATALEDITRRDASCAEDGSFRVGPLMPGEYELTASTFGRDAGSPPIKARAGDEDVKLEIRPAGWIAGRIIDKVSGESVRADITCSHVDHVPDDVLQGDSSQPDGTFECRGLRAGTYNLAARSRDGRFALLRDIEVHAEEGVTGLVIPLVPGAKLRIRFEYSENEYARCRILCGDVYVNTLDLDRGVDSVERVPMGKLTLELTIGDEDHPRVRELEITAGEEKEVAFAGDR